MFINGQIKTKSQELSETVIWVQGLKHVGHVLQPYKLNQQSQIRRKEAEREKEEIDRQTQTDLSSGVSFPTSSKALDEQSQESGRTSVSPTLTVENQVLRHHQLFPHRH